MFSPDGNEVAFVWWEKSSKGPDVSHLYVQLVGAGTPLRLTNSSESDHDPAWSPDGRFIAFRRGRHPAAYYIIPPLGGTERKLADADLVLFAGRGLSWSPDGRDLAVADGGTKADPGGGHRIFYISVESAERRESKVELPGQYVSEVKYAPDGKEFGVHRWVGVPVQRRLCGVCQRREGPCANFSPLRNERSRLDARRPRISLRLRSSRNLDSLESFPSWQRAPTAHRGGRQCQRTLDRSAWKPACVFPLCR